MNINTFLLENFYDKHEFSTPYPLSQSDCEAMAIKELLSLEEGSSEQFMEAWLGYTEVKGGTGLREKIAELYEKASPEDILVHAGAEEAIYNFMRAYLGPEDHIICMSPAYQSLFEVAASVKCGISFWQLRQGENGWKLELDELDTLLRPNTKLIVINTPHNPTGYCLSEEQLNRIISVARERNIFLFCDQVYKGLERDDKKHFWISDLYENSLSLGVMSKAYGLPGLRIGWIATRNQIVYQKLLNYKYYTTICSSAPSEFLTVVALKHKEEILARNRLIIQENLACAEAFFKKYPDIFLNNVPSAGPIAFHKLKKAVSVNEFCDDLIHKKGVLLLPGDVYGNNENYFRMGYGRKSFQEGIVRLEEYIKDSYR